MNPKLDFLQKVGNWNNHRILLYSALKYIIKSSSNPKPILELGMGDGSTPYLANFCEENKIKLLSYDHNPEWVKRFLWFESQYVTLLVADWEKTMVEQKQWSVVLIDQWPGERRHIDAINLKDNADFVVIHDTEPEATGYTMDKVWPYYKYRFDFKIEGHQAHSTILSNRIEIQLLTIPNNYTLE